MKNITIITLTVVVLLLGTQVKELGDSIQLKDENIKIIKNENTLLTQQLENNNVEIAKYKNIIDSFNDMEIKNMNYVYYPIENLSIPQQEYIQNLCWNNDLSYEYILAIMKAESRYNINAISYDNSSKGIMQVQEKYAKSWADMIGMGEYDLFNFEDNVKLGIAVLVNYRSFWQDKGTTDETLFYYMTESYNLGIGGLQKYIKENGTVERGYSKTVLEYKCQLEQQKLN